MLNYRIITKNLPVYFRGLINDTRERYHEDDPREPVINRVAQSERKRGERFTSTGGNCQRKETSRQYLRSAAGMSRSQSWKKLPPPTQPLFSRGALRKIAAFLPGEAILSVT
jgi:hypothetical protein